MEIKITIPDSVAQALAQSDMSLAIRPTTANDWEARVTDGRYCYGMAEAADLQAAVDELLARPELARLLVPVCDICGGIDEGNTCCPPAAVIHVCDNQMFGGDDENV